MRAGSVIRSAGGPGTFKGQIEGTVAGTTEWGTHRRHAGLLLSDALNASIPQIYDTVKDGDSERRVLNTEATEAAKEKLARIKVIIDDALAADRAGVTSGEGARCACGTGRGVRAAEIRKAARDDADRE